MIWAFLSRRLRAWLLFAVALPLGGRLVEALGGRLTERNPRAAHHLTNAGRRMQEPLRGRRTGRRR
ncbi:MAG TPA: hypothetical protein VM433_06965 [Mycobacteriales bacterium]|nr:hypothetical protein [Mycobacteriales bacterium]